MPSHVGSIKYVRFRIMSYPGRQSMPGLAQPFVLANTSVLTISIYVDIIIVNTLTRRTGHAHAPHLPHSTRPVPAGGPARRRLSAGWPAAGRPGHGRSRPRRHPPFVLRPTYP